MSLPKYNKKFIVFLLLILGASLVSVFPLFSSGFIQTDDGNWMVVRFSAFYQALLDGQFPVRWLPRLNNSFGYPVANFLYPGFMYLAVPFKAVGLSYLLSVKVIIILSMVFSAIFSFLWLRKIFVDSAAFIGSLLYLYLPYHIYDLYVRGSVGELLALSCIPFILWQIERKSVFFTAVGLSMLILSHNTLALFSFPVIVAYYYIRAENREQIKKGIVSIVLGVLMASFFWIPALYDIQYTIFSQVTVSDFSNYFADISLVGILAPIILFTSLIFIYKEQVKPSRLFVFFLVLGIGTLFFATKASSFAWEILPISVIQFPFRVLSLFLLSIAFLAAWIFERIRTTHKIIGTAFIILLLFPSFSFIFHSEKSIIDDSIFATNEDTTTVQKEYMPVWVKDAPEKRPDAVLLVDGEAQSNIPIASSHISTTITTEDTVYITYNQLFFPGWKVFVDGRETKVEYELNNGLIVFPLVSGTHDVMISFSETPVRLFSDILSIVSLFILIVFSFYSHRVYERNR